MNRLFLSVITLLSAITSAQNWTWVRGSSSSSVVGVYGTQGTPSAANDPSGRHGCATWTDKAGNLWLFGGEGYTTTATEDLLNDLWKYDKSTNQWTWIRGSQGHNAPGQYGTLGVASLTNEPGAREFMMSWTDTSGVFWLYGGEGYDATGTFGALGDLWKYDPVNNQWTWIHGFNTADQNGLYGTMGVPSATNMPGTRAGSGYWRDANNSLWLFGGEGLPASGGVGRLNDLWKYTPSTNSWTWMKGTNQTGQPGAYGTVSVTASGNLPGGRSFPGSWTAANGDFYMLGGVGHGTMSLLAHLGDFWKYEPATNNWTWMGGQYGGNIDGTYGTKGTASVSVKPGCRQSPATWVDPLGRLWMFGGFGYDGVGSTHGNLNDMFRYDPVVGLWTWIKGDSTLNSPGTQGTQGVSSPANIPGARHYNTFWKHTGPRFWLLGGLGIDDTITVQANRNDLWVFDAPCNDDTIAVSSATMCSGSMATLTAQSPDGSAVSWYTSVTSSLAIGSGTNYVTPPLSASSGPATYTYYATAATCSQSARTAVTLTVLPLPLIAVSGTTEACEGAPFTLTATGAFTYTWNSGSTTAVANVTATAPGYTAIVLGTDQNGCESSSSHTMTIHPKPAVNAIASHTSQCQNALISFTATGASGYSWSTGTGASTFTTVIPQVGTYTYSVTGYGPNGCSAVDSVMFMIEECLGISQYGGSELTVFPNPSEGNIQVRMTELPGAIIEITDAAGRHVLSRTLSGTMALDLPPGVYFARIKGTSAVTRIIIQ